MKKLSSFGISHIIVPIAVVVAVGAIGSAIFAVSHAQTPTAPSVATPATAGNKICMHVIRSECLQANGKGVGVDVTKTSSSSWHFIGAGYGYVYVENASDNCLMTDGVYVYLNACKDNKENKWQILSATNGSDDFKSAYDGKYMGVESGQYVVQVGKAKSGFDYGWNY